MTITKNIKIPIPLFDTLASLKEGTLPPEYYSGQRQTDFKVTIDFLIQYSGSASTFRAYRREMERLLQWTWLIANKSILDLGRSDIEQYIVFCQKPPIAWIGTKTLVTLYQQ